MRFHVLGIPHTATNKWHASCAYTQKVRRLCAMLRSLGHYVIHYGNERSEVDCDEHVSITTHKDLIDQYGDGPGRTCDYKYSTTDPLYMTFYANAIGAIAPRKRPHDFLLCMWGYGHKPIADAHPDLIAVEPGIGYTGTFARWKVFESYCILHAHMGMGAIERANAGIDWYNVVIPNFFDPSDFDYSEHKSKYLLFLGRPGPAKGLHIAAEIARVAELPLIVAGAGEAKDIPPGCEFVGFADWSTRRRLLSQARALIAPSQFVEPFCGVLIEAAFSGTPVITVDWGAAAENVLHGMTGYRCRTFEHFTWAAKNIDRIKPQICYDWAISNFSTARVRDLYAEYFQTVMDVHTGPGWYTPRADRSNLDWLERRYPNGRSKSADDLYAADEDKPVRGGRCSPGPDYASDRGASHAAGP